MSAVRRISILFAAACASANVDVLNEILKGGVERSVYPGTVAVIGNKQGPLYSNAVGRHSYDKSDTIVKAETLFDLASLTKVVSTTSVVALLYQNGYFNLDTKVADILGDDFKNGGKDNITVLNCLLHNAGFAPDPVPWYWDPAFGCPNTAHEYPEEDFSCLNSMIYSSFMAETLVTPPGEAYVYSDLSFITLQMVVGTVVLENDLVSKADMAQCLSLQSGVQTLRAGAPPMPQQIVCAYEAFVRTQVFHRPADTLTTSSDKWMPTTGFLPVEAVWSACAPTLNDTGSGSYTHKRLQGQVADGDCYAMGGIAGHAGVFSTAGDVGKLAQYWLAHAESTADTAHPVQAGSVESGVLPFLNATTVQLFSTAYNLTQSSRALGWSTNTPQVQAHTFPALP
jgi:CubicO group peptidase (beta-lactamase class C family)